MKAIIPVAGAGTTLRPHTHTHPKPLLPVAGRPILGHIVEGMLSAGVDEFLFVIGHLGDKIREYIESICDNRFTATFVNQSPRRGLAHAIHICQEYVAPNEPLVIALGDTIIETDLPALIAAKQTVLCVQKVDNPWEFGVAVLDAEGNIKSLVEKPQIPKSNLALVGLYKIVETDLLFQATQHLIDTNHRTRGEYQLTDALQFMVEQGVQMTPFRVQNWHNCGKKEVLLETNRLLLKHVQQTDHPEFPNSIIRPPVFIPENVTIEGSIVGPNVAVGEHAIIRSSIIQDSILGAYSHLEGVVLKESVIGNDARLTGRFHAINIGDNTELDFNL